MSHHSDHSLHPCFSEKAHLYFSRIHLPVAPKCNIQCNYCNRKYDCVNESRPGVTSTVLSPESALQLVHQVAARRRDLSVVGIAGPGDALANAGKTFKTLGLIREAFPDLLLCLSTNGLELVNHMDALCKTGVNHVTVTINTLSPEIAAQVYSHVRIDGQKRTDINAIGEFLYRQEKGIRALVQAGILVKANSILIPGINDKELVGLSKRLKLMGVTLHNILPLLASPEIKSLFSRQGRPEPGHEELESVRVACGSMRQMAHCRQCRADAIGRLGEATTIHDAQNRFESAGHNPETARQQREHWRQTVRDRIQGQSQEIRSTGDCPTRGAFSGKIAVCTRDGSIVGGDLQSNGEFHIYRVQNGIASLINIRKRDLEGAMNPKKLFAAIEGCQAVISPKFGYAAFKSLEASGILPVSDLGGRSVDEAVGIVVRRLGSGCSCPSRSNLPAAINH